MPELDNISSLFNNVNLVAYYKLENTADSKGSAILTNNGTATFVRGKFGNAADLGTPNTSKYFSTTGLTSAGKENAITISCWIKLKRELTADETLYILYLGETVANYIAFEIRYECISGSKYVYANRRRESVVNQPTSNVNGALGINVFHHICMTHDGTTLKVYVDAGTPGTTAASGNGASAGSENAEFRIGRSRTADNKYADVIIDDVAIWSRALSATEITTLYQETESRLKQYRRTRRPGLIHGL